MAVTARRKEILDEIVARIRVRGGEAYSFPGDVLNLDEMKESYAYLAKLS